MFIPESRRPLCLFLLVLIFSGSLLITILPDFCFHGIRQVNEQLHSAIEAFGAMAALSISLLFLNFHQDGEREKGEYFLLSMGFLMMGILDTFIAVSITGHGFHLLHSLRNFFGGVWFALMWLPASGAIVKIKAVPWIVAIFSVLLGFTVLLRRELFPLMVLNGEFTPFAIVISSITAVLLLAAAVYFLIEFLRFSTTESYLLTCVFALLGVSAYEFRVSPVWTEDWWFWHIQRFLAYVVIFFYIFRTFLRVREELKTMNEDLEKQVDERTADLLLEVAERKRYGMERDAVILELQDALTRIKTLTGLLPTCASCKKIRNSKGDWEQMEFYIQNHSAAKFSHGLCPPCAKKLYPDFYEEIMRKTLSPST
jgi:hypothetical protein